MLKLSYAVLPLSIMALLTIGCSGGNSGPITPQDTPDESTHLITTENTGDINSNHTLWGMWNIYFDAADLKIAIEPVRNAQKHFNITDMVMPPACDDCLKIKVNSFDPITRILDADVTLRNPTKLSAHDVRGILYTNDYGHELLNADDWTGLFDILGGEDINPFKAFAKGEPKRKFAGEAEHFEKYLLYIPKPPQWGAITFAVDASWPGNCKEPYAITNFYQDMIYNYTGSKGEILVDVSDWQGDVDSVILAAPEITGEESTPFNNYPGDTWQLELENITGVGAGDYPAMVTATSTGPGSQALYDFFDITISAEGTPNPDVVKTLKSGSGKGIAVAGDYAYVAAGNQHLKIIDINPPSLAYVVNTITDVWANDVDVAGGYAYVVGDFDFHIVNVEPPESAHVVNAFHIGSTGKVTVSGGYAYVLAAGAFKIIDITPPDEATVVKTVLGFLDYSDVAVQEGFAYVINRDVAEEESYLKVIDVDPAETAEIVKILTFPGTQVGGIDVCGGYAYTTLGGGGNMEVVDIDPVDAAHSITNLFLGASASPGLVVSGGYVYATMSSDYLKIADVSPPEDSSIYGAVELWGTHPTDVALSGSYAYVTSSEQLDIIKLW